MLKRVLDFNWRMLLEDIGLWIPPTVYHIEHDDKPENVQEEEEIVPGPPLPPECNAELHTDYGGTAVRWGLTIRSPVTDEEVNNPSSSWRRFND